MTTHDRLETPSGRVHVPDCGHAPLEELPDEACPPVIAFLEAGT